jgi:hypothetical protein
LDQADRFVAGTEDEKIGAIASIEQGAAASPGRRSRDDLHSAPCGDRCRLLPSRVTRGASVNEADD